MSEVLIRRQACSDNFTIVKNSILRDATISWSATGILAFLLSLPADWRLHLSHLASQKTNGRHSTRAALAELEKAGYLKIEKIRGKNGKFLETVWTVFDVPTRASKGIQPRSENPNTVKPKAVNPKAEKPTLERTGFKNTDFINTTTDTTGGEVVDLEEIVKAGLWALQQIGKTTGPGLPAHIRARVAKEGANEKDLANLAAWRNAKTKKETGFFTRPEKKKDQAIQSQGKKKIQEARQAAGIK